MLLYPSEELFFICGLNMDLRSTKGIDLRDFLIRNEFKTLFINLLESVEAISRKRKNLNH